MTVTELSTKQEYLKLVQDNPYVAIQASATWCGPCKAISPIFAKHAGEHAAPSKYAFAKFDIDQVPDLANELGIRSVPAFFFFKDGDLDESITGANVPKVKKQVEAYAAQAKEGGNTVREQ